MKTTINHTDIKFTDSMYLKIVDSLKFLEKFLATDDTLTLNIKKSGEQIKISSIIKYNNSTIKVEKSNNDFYACIDEISNVVKNKISKTHEKIKEHKERIDKKDIGPDDIIDEDISDEWNYNRF